jgi:hypothetical protein
MINYPLAYTSMQVDGKSQSLIKFEGLDNKIKNSHDNTIVNRVTDRVAKTCVALAAPSWLRK